MRYLGGHLGVTVSALLDGQLDPSSTERAWTHVHGCRACRARVEREGWVKTQLAAIAEEQGPPAQLMGSLYGLGSAQPGPPPGSGHDPAAWAAVRELERRGRGRRRAGLAVAGAGSVSAAVLGIASLTGATLGIGGTPAGTPSTSSLMRGPATATSVTVAPVARVQGRLPVTDPSRLPTTPGGQASRGEEGGAGLSR